jgi:hypothetical protein
MLVVGPIDPCNLREMPLSVFVDREGRLRSAALELSILIFEAGSNALLAE